MEVTKIIDMITKVAADSSKNIKIRVEYDFGDDDGDADISIDTFHNKNNEGGCDRARTLLQTILGVSEPTSVTPKPGVEGEILAPDEEEAPEVDVTNVQAPAIAPKPENF